MDILAFMKPKSEVVFVYADDTLETALEVMERHRFTSIPVLDRDGRYAGSLTEGDLLWTLKETFSFDIRKAKGTPVAAVPRNRPCEPIDHHATIDALIGKASRENFVPIVDDQGLFLGIVTRKTLLDYFFEHRFVVL